jgi:hypothetical protein
MLHKPEQLYQYLPTKQHFCMWNSTAFEVEW